MQNNLGYNTKKNKSTFREIGWYMWYYTCCFKKGTIPFIVYFQKYTTRYGP